MTPDKAIRVMEISEVTMHWRGMLIIHQRLYK